jgi:hypothetical protein
LWKKLSTRGFLEEKIENGKRDRERKEVFCSGGVKERKEESKLRGATWKCRTECGR